MLSLASSLSRFKINWFVAAVRGLAGVLAGAILLFELLSTNGQFHQALHPGGKAASNICVVCLFAKGQVDSPQVIPAVSACVWSWFDPAPRMESAPLVDFAYLVSPSRAPPAFVSLSPVVA